MVNLKLVDCSSLGLEVIPQSNKLLRKFTTMSLRENKLHHINFTFILEHFPDLETIHLRSVTFDFKCYFDERKAEELRNTKKLPWQSAHVPLSVSVCSNVPNYEDPKSFVSDGNSDLLLEEFVKYLTMISTRSSNLLHQQCACL